MPQIVCSPHVQNNIYVCRCSTNSAFLNNPITYYGWWTQVFSEDAKIDESLQNGKIHDFFAKLDISTIRFG